MKTSLQLQLDALAECGWDRAIDVSGIGIAPWPQRFKGRIHDAARRAQVWRTGVLPAWPDRELACQAAGRMSCA